MPRHHGGAQGAIHGRGGAVLRAKEGVDEVPSVGKALLVCEQPPLQQLHLDQDGHELGVGPVKRVHDHLVEQRGLRRAESDGPLSVLCGQPTGLNDPPLHLTSRGWSRQQCCGGLGHLRAFASLLVQVLQPGT